MPTDDSAQCKRQAPSDYVLVDKMEEPWRGKPFCKGLSPDDPTCERCLQEDESATYILCDCEAIAHLRFRHLGQFFMEPSDFYDAPIFKVLHFIRSVGLTRGYR
jgi:hypothetical protein